MKKIISLILIAAMLLSAVPSAGAQESLTANVSSADLEKAVNSIAAAVAKIDELKESAGQVSSAFSEFMKVAGYAGTALSVVNGTVTFLRLIGVMRDPVRSGIGNILDQLSTVNESLTEMNTKLDEIADAMTTMQASAEFYNRGNKAQAMRTAWNTFAYNYMENGLDPLMTRYNGMLINGIKSWCLNATENSRTEGGVDNRSVMLVYVPDSEGKEQPLFFRGNQIPAQYADCRWVILSNECLPDSFTFDVNSYKTALAEDIAGRIYSALESENYAALPSYGFPMLTAERSGPIDTDAVMALAADAVDMLVYRIGCVQVNADATFALDVNDKFTNYCSHLFASGDGIDAMLKSFYLTHAFEFEVKEDLTDFLDRMMLKTGVYASFVTNVLGMSDAVTDSAKLNATATFCRAVEDTQSALDGCCTGTDNYCYINNSVLYYTNLSIKGWVLVNTDTIYNDKQRYNSCRSGTITPVVDGFSGGTYSQVGDVNSLVLFYTLQNNGVTALHKYLYDHARKVPVADRGVIVTSFGSQQTMPLDGSVTMRAYNVIGDDYAGISTCTLTGNDNDYPDNAKRQYIYDNRKLCGTTYTVASGTLSTNTTLLATAAYGQNHWNWFFDESALFCGPANYGKFFCDLTHSQKDKFNSDDYITGETLYNTLVCVPLAALKAFEGYDPLSSFRALSALIEEENAGLRGPVSPVTYPAVTKADELDLTGTVWEEEHRGGDSDEEIINGCLPLIEDALKKAGFKSSALSDSDKEALAGEMLAEYRRAVDELDGCPLYNADPLGIGQNNDAVKKLAVKLLPDYLLTGAGAVSEDVKYLFLRNFVQASPTVSFTARRGKPVSSVGRIYTVSPYLIVGEISGGCFQLLTYKLDEAFMKQNKLNLTLRLPADAYASKGAASVRCYNNAEDKLQLQRMNVTTVGRAPGSYTEFAVKGTCTAFVLGEKIKYDPGYAPSPTPAPTPTPTPTPSPAPTSAPEATPAVSADAAKESGTVPESSEESALLSAPADGAVEASEKAVKAQKRVRVLPVTLCVLALAALAAGAWYYRKKKRK